MKRLGVRPSVRPSVPSFARLCSGFAAERRAGGRDIDRQRTLYGRVGSGRVRVLVVEFDTGRTRLCRWSGLVASFPNSTAWTGPDQTCPRL